MTKKKSKQNALIITLVSIIIILSLGLVFAFMGDKVSYIFRYVSGERIVTVPQGTPLNVTLASSISSGVNMIGDVISANLTSPVVIGEDLLFPAGSELRGKVTSSVSAMENKGGKGGFLEIRFNSIQKPSGNQYPINVASIQFSGLKGRTLNNGVKKTLTGAAVGAALGTAIGAISGGKKSVGRGAWSGTAIGGGLGATSALLKRGNEATLGRGALLTVNLDQPLQVTAKKN